MFDQKLPVILLVCLKCRFPHRINQKSIIPMCIFPFALLIARLYGIRSHDCRLRWFFYQLLL